MIVLCIVILSQVYAVLCVDIEYVLVSNSNRCIGNAFLVYETTTSNQRLCAIDVQRDAPLADAFTFYRGNRSCCAHQIGQASLNGIGVLDPTEQLCLFYKALVSLLFDSFSLITF